MKAYAVGLMEYFGGNLQIIHYSIMPLYNVSEVNVGSAWWKESLYCALFAFVGSHLAITLEILVGIVAIPPNVTLIC